MAERNRMISLQEASEIRPRTGLELLTAQEVAQRLRVSLRSVYDLAGQQPRRLGVVRLGRRVRFRRDAIDTLLGPEQ